MGWHLAPFQRRAPEIQAFPVDLYVQQRDQDTDPPVHSLFVANVLRYRRHDLGEVLEHAVWALQAEVSKRTRDLVLLHAGVVSRAGGAVLIPASTGRGKSTLVLALLQRGFSYLSDELGAIDPVTGLVYPYEKRIGVNEETLALFEDLGDRLQDRSELTVTMPKRYVRPEDVGATTAGPSRPSGLVFLGEDRSGAPRLAPISRAEAVERMARHSTNLFRYGERGVIVLSRVAEGAPAYLLEGGTPAERAALLDDRMD